MCGHLNVFKLSTLFLIRHVPTHPVALEAGTLCYGVGKLSFEKAYNKMFNFYYSVGGFGWLDPEIAPHGDLFGISLLQNVYIELFSRFSQYLKICSTFCNEVDKLLLDKAIGFNIDISPKP